MKDRKRLEMGPDEKNSSLAILNILKVKETVSRKCKPNRGGLICLADSIDIFLYFCTQMFASRQMEKTKFTDKLDCFTAHFH